MGCGAEDVAKCVFGHVPRSSGRILVEGREVKIRRPVDAIRNGIAYVPSERKSEGLILNQSMRMNVVDGARPHQPVDPRENRGRTETSREWVEKLGIRTPDVETEVGSLSGGNQQKIVIAKWMATQPKILLLNDPTRGIDVGAKADLSPHRGIVQDGNVRGHDVIGDAGNDLSCRQGRRPA